MQLDTLLISTNRKLLLYCDGRVFTIHEGYGGYAGMTWCNDYIYVMALKERYGPESYGLVFDHGFRLVRSVFLPGISGPHQCIYRAGEVFIANCDHNCVSAWDRWDKVRTVWSTGVTKIPEDKSTDAHINSIWYDDKRFYICEHRHGPSKVRMFNFDWKEEGEWDIGNEIHNVFVDGDKVYVCNSARESILVRDLASGKDSSIYFADKLDWMSMPVERFIRHSYTRGLARGEKYMYIGCSAITLRGDRDKGQCVVAIFDDNLNYLDKIILDDTGGLGGIRVVNGLDRAHNGLCCPWDGRLPDG